MDTMVIVFVWLLSLTVLFGVLCNVVDRRYRELLHLINGLDDKIVRYYERTKDMIVETDKFVHDNRKQLCKDGMNNEKKFGSLERRVNYIIDKLTDANQYEIYKKVYADEHEQKETRL